MNITLIIENVKSCSETMALCNTLVEALKNESVIEILGQKTKVYSGEIDCGTVEVTSKQYPQAPRSSVMGRAEFELCLVN